MIVCTLVFEKDIDDIYSILLPESKQSRTSRGMYSLKKDKTLKITIKAKDTVVLKAYFNSIIKIIESYYKVIDLKNGRTEQREQGEGRATPAP